MAAELTYPHLSLGDDHPPRLSRHPRLRVAQIVMDYLAHGWSAEEMCRQHPHLLPGEVHSAMAYYYDHRQSIDDEIQQDVDAANQSRASSSASPFAMRMKKEGRF